MSIDDLSVQTDCFTRLSQSHSLPYYQIISDISSKPAVERSTHERKILAEFLYQISNIHQSFKAITDYKTYLLQCSDLIEVFHFRRSTPLILRGDKCDDVFIIFDGTVNVYDLKTPQEIQKQKQEYEEFRTRSARNKFKTLTAIFPASPSRKLTSSTNLIRTRKQALTLVQEGEKPELENPAIGECPTNEAGSLDGIPSGENSPVIKPTATVTASMTDKILSTSVLNLLKSSSKHRKTIEEDPYQKFDHLPEREQLLLEDRICRMKYYKDGACLLSLKDTIGPGDIVNEKCLFHDYRSPVTLVAEDDIKCIKLKKEPFRQIFRKEIKGREEKKSFFLNFFQKVRQGGILQALDYIVEKNYKHQEKIFNQGEETDGVYFIKEGEVKLYLHVSQKNKETEEKTDLATAELFLPNQHKALRKQTMPVAIISQGDFFGEEGITGENKTRKYTARSASNELVLYHIPTKFYPWFSQMLPELFNTLKERAEQRNAWTAEKIKAREYLSPSQNSPLMSPSSQRSQKAIIIKTEKQGENKNISKHSIFQEENSRLITELNLREKDMTELKMDTEPAKYPHTREQKDAKSYYLNRDNAADKRKEQIRIRNMRNSEMMRSMELPPSIKLFEHEKEQHKIYKPKVPEGKQRRNSRTNTGLKKDKGYLHALQNLVIKQTISQDSPGRPQTSMGESFVIKKGPQFEVKSYTAVQSKSPSIHLCSPTSADANTSNIIKDEFGVSKVSTSARSVNNLSHAPSPQVGSPKVDASSAQQSPKTESFSRRKWPKKRAQSDTQEIAGILSCRPMMGDFKTTVNTFFDTPTRKGSKPYIMNMSNMPVMTRIETEPNSSMNQFQQLMSSQNLNGLRPKNKTNSLASRKYKAGSLF